MRLMMLLQSSMWSKVSSNRVNGHKLTVAIASFIKCSYNQNWSRDIFLALRQQQCDNSLRDQSGTRKNRKIVRPQCLDGVATINIVKWQLQTTLWPDYIVTLSQQNCCVPSSAYNAYSIYYMYSNLLFFVWSCHYPWSQPGWRSSSLPE